MLAQDPRPLQEKQGLLAQVCLLCSILFAGNDAAYSRVSSQLRRQTELPCWMPRCQILSGSLCPRAWWSSIVGMSGLPEQSSAALFSCF